MRFLLLSLLCLFLGLPVAAQDGKSVDDKAKEIAGTAEFLRSVPKRFAILEGMDRVGRRVHLRVEPETTPKWWPLAPEAEIKRYGWWARLDQLKIGDRVWVWLQLDRVGQPVAVSMLCDEMSEQDIHGGIKIESFANHVLTVKPFKSATRQVVTSEAEIFRGKAKAKLESFPKGEAVFVQSAKGNARLVLDTAAFEARRAEQKSALRQRWLDEGLPGTVTFLHQFSGEMELTLDHETMRWARAVKPGDRVTLRASPLIPGVVKWMKPWRERTLLRLVVRGSDQADFTLGQRVLATLPVPSADVEASRLPPDVDRLRPSEERVEWFLASVYCTCRIMGDVCTGQFYTLASCNPNGCGQPNAMREEIAEKIKRGLTDRQIFEELIKDHGPDLLRPHLQP